MTTELLEQARSFTKQGFSVIPIKNKKPPKDFTWTDRRKKLATEQELVTWFSNGEADSAAITIDDTEFAIDTDGSCESLFNNKVIARLSPELAEAVFKTTRTKTPNGNHRLFKINAQEFPDGIKEKLYVKLDGHSEIALKGKGHYLTECGPGYEIVNDIESLVRLRKEQVEELLNVLEAVKAETYGVKSIVGILLPYYTNGKRDNLVFALSGYLHKNGVSESFISEIVESLVYQKKDEEPQVRLRVVKDTCSKDRNSDQVSGYSRLLEALDNNQNGIADIEKILNELEFGKFNIDRKTEESDGDEEKHLVATKLTKEDIDFVLKTMIKEAKHDGLSIKQIFHGFNSAFTKTPIPHVVDSKDSGAGKSYLLNHVASFYPDMYILPLAGLSDKAIFHSNGPMIVEDEITGELRHLEPIINDLETQIEDLQENDKKGNKKKIKEIQSEIQSLVRSAQKLIDLTNKIIIIQDTPSFTVFNLLMTLLSQDSPKDQLYAFTDKTSGSGKLIQSRNRIRGMPVIFTTQVIDDTDNQRFEEKNRRFIHVTPKTTKEKIREANRLTALRYGYLKDEYDRLVVNRADVEKTKKTVRVIIAKLKRHTMYLESKDTGVKVPFALTILVSLPNDGRVWEMTVAERTMKYLSMVTKLNMDSRPRIVDRKTSAFYPIATYEDLRETLVLMERGGSNLRPYLAEWYDLVLIPKYEEQNDIPKTAYNDVGIKISEAIVGVTTEELADKTVEILKCTKPSIEEIRKRYLDPLINQGIVNKDQSRINSKHNIYFPVDKANYRRNNINEDGKVKVSDKNLFPTRKVLEQSFDKVFSYDEDGIVKNTKILEDENGQEITLDKLLDTYFTNPDDYFVKAYREE